MPEYKLMKKINWSSSESNSQGKLKSRPNNEPLTEENLMLGNTAGSNQTATSLLAMSKLINSIENGTNLSIKPNDIEKLSTTESTLLVVMESNSNPSKKQRQQVSTQPLSTLKNIFGMFTLRMVKLRMNGFQPKRFSQIETCHHYYTLFNFQIIFMFTLRMVKLRMNGFQQFYSLIFW